MPLVDFEVAPLSLRFSYVSDVCVEGKEFPQNIFHLTPYYFDRYESGERQRASSTSSIVLSVL